MFSAELSLPSKITAIEVAINHTTIWRFLKGCLKLFPYKPKLHQIIRNLSKVKKTYVAYYCLNKLGIDCEIRKQFLCSDKCNFFIVGVSEQAKLLRTGTILFATGIQYISELLLGYGMLHFVAKYSNLIFHDWKRLKTELQIDALVIIIINNSENKIWQDNQGIAKYTLYIVYK